MEQLYSFFDKESIAPLIAAGAVLGTVFGVILRGWGAVKSFFNSIASIFIVSVELDDEMTSKVVLSYLLKNFKRVTSGKRKYSSKHNCLRNGKFGYVPFELFGNKTVLFRNGFFPFLFCVTEIKSDEKHIYWHHSNDAPKFKASILFLRYSLDIDKIIADSSQERNNIYWSKAGKRRFFVKKVPDSSEQGHTQYSVGTSLEWFNEGVYRLIGFSPEELGRSSSGGNALDNLFFPKKVKNIINEIKIWYDLKDWYLERGIPWRRGWCLYGPPGTGKTALVRAISEDLDMPLFVFALGRMTDTDLERSWNELQAHTPCIALFEDFDTVFHGRENVYGKPTLAEQIAGSNPPKASVPGADESGISRGQLSFGCLLNCIDGAEKTNGIFTVFTTNHIDKLDPALGLPRTNSDGTVEFISTRPGRIDKAIELGYITNEDKKEFAKKIFSNNPENLKLIFKDIEDNFNKQETPAQFQEHCTQLALQRMWIEVEEGKIVLSKREGNNTTKTEKTKTKKFYTRWFTLPRKKSPVFHAKI
jgi:hypothetical protein